MIQHSIKKIKKKKKLSGGDTAPEVNNQSEITGKKNC